MNGILTRQAWVVLLVVFCVCSHDLERGHEFKYAIETNTPIETTVTYLYNNTYNTEQIKTQNIDSGIATITEAFWISPAQEIETNHYASISMKHTDSAGWFYFIVDGEIYDYSYISNFADQTWKFAWYINIR